MTFNDELFPYKILDKSLFMRLPYNPPLIDLGPDQVWVSGIDSSQ